MTDKTECYAIVDVINGNLDDLLAEWQHHYNWEGPQHAQNSQLPTERCFELIHDTPNSHEIYKDYHPEKACTQEVNYKIDLELQELKRSL